LILPISEIAQQRTVRLIPTAYYKPPVLRALVDSDEELEELARIEGLTSKRLVNATPTVGLDYDAWGRTFISAAFTYTRKGGNRFNDETSGAWYAGFDDRTSLHEVAFHKTRELTYIGYFHDEVQYRALHAAFIGRFHDLRSSSPRPVCLDPDPSIGYPEGQALARRLVSESSRGLIYPSVRNPGGVCLVAFQPNVVQDLSPGACWKITWDGTPSWHATAV
jgi:hypothetical protein